MIRNRVTNLDTFNGQSLREEVVNSIAHGLGALLASAGAAILIVFACLKGDTVGIVSSAVYGFSLILLFSMSALYHAFTNIKIKRVFQVLDHCSIFILIFGTYTPLCLIALRDRSGFILWCANALFTALGITANAINTKRWHKWSLLLYLCMGWSVVFSLRAMLSALTLDGFLLLLAGGVCYSVGTLFYMAPKPRYMHSVWHFFVLAGAILHYLTILIYVI